MMLLSKAASAELCSDNVINEPIDLTPLVNGWGLDQQNTRFVAERRAGIDSESVKRLKPQWVFGLPETSMPRTQPMVSRNTVFIADEQGIVYALDREMGCVRWTFAAQASVRTALRFIQIPEENDETVAKPAMSLLVFGDASAFVYAVDPATGALRWRVKADSHDKAMISGSPNYSDGRVYVPVSSWEAMWAVNPFYDCCTFRSSVLSLDARTGDEVWRRYTVDEPAKLIEERMLFGDKLGPSGAPVWSVPTIDTKRKRIYVGSGENYSSPATDKSDAIIAISMDTGEVVWHQQFLSNDAWNVSCEYLGLNCPEERGVDLDFGAPPVLAKYKRKSYLFAGQKNGTVIAMDPDDNGRVIWRRKIGRGGKLGGVHFGMALGLNKGLLYVPISDRAVQDLGRIEEGTPAPGLHALDIETGETRWYAPADPCEDINDCFTGYSAAVTASEALVFAPSLDGTIHAHDTATGERVWRYATAGPHASVNGIETNGGSIDVGGVYLSNGQLFVNSGYDVFGQKAGNAFMVFSIDEEQQAPADEPQVVPLRPAH